MSSSLCNDIRDELGVASVLVDITATGCLHAWFVGEKGRGGLVLGSLTTFLHPYESLRRHEAVFHDLADIVTVWQALS